MNAAGRAAIKGCALALSLVLAILVIYAPVRDYGFVQLDDNEYVTENSFVLSGLNPASVQWAWTAYHSGHWHPLTWLSLMLDCHLFGVDAGAMHVVNVILQVLACLLFYRWLAAATGHDGRSALVAALFALHPLRVESVAWVTGRKDVLSGVLLMLTLLGYVRYAQRPSAVRYLLVIVCFALGLTAKPTLAVVPCALLLLDYWPLGRWRGGPAPSAAAAAPLRRSAAVLFAEKLPLIGLALATLSQTYAAQRAAGAMVGGDRFGFGDRLANAAWSFLRYLELTFRPVDLAVFYPLRPLAAWKPLAAGLVLALLLISAWRRRVQQPYLLVGVLWFVGTLIPVSGLLQFGGQAMADRYTYIPHIGLLVALVWAAASLRQQWSLAPAWGYSAAAAVLTLLAVRSSGQLSYWRDSISLLEHAIAVTEDNFLAHNNLGVAWQNLGRLDEASQHFSEAARLNPSWPEAQNNLGLVYAWRGDYATARVHFAEALRLRPDFDRAENNLATAFAYEGDYAAAAVHYQRALAINPGNLEARFALADAFERLGRLEEAERELLEVIARRPDWEQAQAGLARVRAARGGR